MPGKLKAKIVAGRHLPVMDRASDLTDAFVEVRFGNTTFKTEVYPKSLNPQWNSDWFKFEVDDEELQDELLQITVLDHDTYSANSAIGKVYIDIDPLLSREAAKVISGWFPIYDTIHGIRGEINVVVTVDLFKDLNRFRQSSCGVKFFCSTSIPRCYRVVAVLGFVEELVVNEDPEYQWIDRIRTPRASNEARQRLMSLMSGELQRKIGLKVLEMGGNALVGYLQCFDLEGESGLVVRAIGTACTLDKLSYPSTATPPTGSSLAQETKESLPAQGPSLGCHSTHNSPVHSPSGPRLNQGFSVSVPSLVFAGMRSRGSFEREGGPFKPVLKQQTQSALEQGEFPFVSLTSFPPEFLVNIGGVVSARSVKLLNQINNPDEPETRDAWWKEIRLEIKSHAKAMGCHAVLGYSESTSICEEVCILSASGTAAIVNPRLTQWGHEHVRFPPGSPPGCGFCHAPYDELSMPFSAELTRCSGCRWQKVPDVLFATVDLPAEATVTGKGSLIQARLCRLKKKGQGESNAMAVSSLLPFMEYELHAQLMKKLKLRGMNALFGLRVQISLGENMLVGLASATGVYLTALPPPAGIQIYCRTSADLTHEQHIYVLQKKINDMVSRNKERYDIPEVVREVFGSPIPESSHHSGLSQCHSESSDEGPTLDLSHGNKDAFVLEIDDADTEDDIHSLLTDMPAPAGFYSCSSGVMPGIRNWTLAQQMFTSVRLFRLSSVNLTNQGLNKMFNDLCENLLTSLYFKLRAMIPCCLCCLNFRVAVPEDELIQVAVTAVAMTFDKDQAQESWKLDVEKTSVDASFHEKTRPLPAARSQSLWSTRSFGEGAATVKEVKMTPLSFIPGTWIVKYLGIINMFFIRETTSLREEGGVSGFLHTFIAEVLSMVRAHVAALGGNAVVSYSMKECVFMENPNKNQAQCLVNVSGDAVRFVRQSELKATTLKSQVPIAHHSCYSTDIGTGEQDCDAQLHTQIYTHFLPHTDTDTP